MRNLSLFMVLCIFLCLSSCASLRGKHNVTNSTSPTGVAGSSQAIPPEPKSELVYYDFKDVPIPKELHLRPKESQVFQVGDSMMGLLVFRGYVDPGSLIDFFQVAMVREGWNLLSSVRYRRAVLLFEKPKKACFIVIYERFLFTYLEVYVLPITSRI